MRNPEANWYCSRSLFRLNTVNTCSEVIICSPKSPAVFSDKLSFYFDFWVYSWSLYYLIKYDKRWKFNNKIIIFICSSSSQLRRRILQWSLAQTYVCKVLYWIKLPQSLMKTVKCISQSITLNTCLLMKFTKKKHKIVCL